MVRRRRTPTVPDKPTPGTPPAAATSRRRRRRTPPAFVKKAKSPVGRELLPGDRIPEVGTVLRACSDPVRTNIQYLLVRWAGSGGYRSARLSILMHDMNLSDKNHEITRPWSLPAECMRALTDYEGAE